MAIRYTHLATGLIRPFKAILFFPQADFACLILLYLTYLAAYLPCFGDLHIPFDLTFLFVIQSGNRLFRS